MDLQSFKSNREALEARRREIQDELSGIEQALGIGRKPRYRGVILLIFNLLSGKSEITTKEIRDCILDAKYDRHNVGPVVNRLIKMGVLVRTGHGLYSVHEDNWRQ